MTSVASWALIGATVILVVLATRPPLSLGVGLSAAIVFTGAARLWRAKMAVGPVGSGLLLLALLGSGFVSLAVVGPGSHSDGDRAPGGQSYGRTDPEACFVSEADAQTAGFRASQR